MMDVNNIVISGIIVDSPKFVTIKESTKVVATFRINCDRSPKSFDPSFTFNVTSVIGRLDISKILRGARVMIVGYISNTVEEGIEKTVIHGRELLPFPHITKRSFDE